MSSASLSSTVSRTPASPMADPKFNSSGSGSGRTVSAASGSRLLGTNEKSKAPLFIDAKPQNFHPIKTPSCLPSLHRPPVNRTIVRGADLETQDTWNTYFCKTKTARERVRHKQHCMGPKYDSRSRIRPSETPSTWIHKPRSDTITSGTAFAKRATANAISTTPNSKCQQYLVYLCHSH
jgi:hypothetical protein